MSEEKKQEMTKEEQEMFAKLAQAETVEEVLAVVKEYGKEISEEQAKEILEKISAAKKSGELSDDDLDNVAGGSYSWSPEWTQEQQAEWMRQQIAALSMSGLAKLL